MADVAQEGLAGADRLAGLLADQAHVQRPLAPGLARLPSLVPAVVRGDGDSGEQEDEIDGAVVRGHADADQDPDGDDVDQVSADPVQPARVVSCLADVAALRRAIAARGLAVCARLAVGTGLAEPSGLAVARRLVISARLLGVSPGWGRWRAAIPTRRLAVAVGGTGVAPWRVLISHGRAF